MKHLVRPIERQRARMSERQCARTGQRERAVLTVSA